MKISTFWEFSAFSENFLASFEQFCGFFDIIILELYVFSPFVGLLDDRIFQSARIFDCYETGKFFGFIYFFGVAKFLKTVFVTIKFFLIRSVVSEASQ